MDDRRSKDSGEEGILSFALIIDQMTLQTTGQRAFEIRSGNQGINEADLILILDAVLEKAKQNYKTIASKGDFFVL